MNPFEITAKLRDLYPEDINAIEAEEEQIKKLLARKEYSQLPETQELLALCRREIVVLRLRLARERSATEEVRRNIWAAIDAKEWLLSILGKDFDSEIQAIENELRAELER